MFISEIYPCLQGEGRLLGVPSVLVRTSGCNLRCQWGTTKCDTPYTSWEPVGETFTVDEVVAKTSHAAGAYIRHVIISGGEPTIQGLELADLCKQLKLLGFHITIETNGTRYVDTCADLLSISPKLRSSTPVGTEWESKHENERLNPTTLAHLLAGYDSYLKFVILNEEDVDEVLHLLQAMRDQTDLSRDRVYLMPEGYTRAEQELRKKAVAELAQHYGFRYSPRLHIDLYDSKRGV